MDQATVRRLETQIAELREEVSEITKVAEATLVSIIGREKFDEWRERYERWEQRARFDAGTPVYRIGIEHSAWRLVEADIYTVEEAATRRRSEIEAIPGVGRVSVGKLETAMAERGLTWAETS